MFRASHKGFPKHHTFSCWRSTSYSTPVSCKSLLISLYGLLFFNHFLKSMGLLLIQYENLMTYVRILNLRRILTTYMAVFGLMIELFRIVCTFVRYECVIRKFSYQVNLMFLTSRLILQYLLDAVWWKYKYFKFHPFNVWKMRSSS